MTLANTLSNEMLQGAQKQLLSQTFLAVSGSRDIQGSTTGTTTSPEYWKYTPSAGQVVFVTNLQIEVLDNTQWASSSDFGDSGNALTSGCDIGVKFAGAPADSIINASNTQYYDRNNFMYRLTRRCNPQLLLASATQDDRALFAYFDLTLRQKVRLSGDDGDYIFIAIRQSLATPAIKIFWATVGGYLQ